MKLFTPIKLGNLTLNHRVAMAPLTRSRAGQPGNVPTPMNVEYYRQKSSRKSTSRRYPKAMATIVTTC